MSYEQLKKQIKDSSDKSFDVNYLERGEYSLFITESGWLGIEVFQGPTGSFKYDFLKSLKN